MYLEIEGKKYELPKTIQDISFAQYCGVMAYGDMVSDLLKVDYDEAAHIELMLGCLLDFFSIKGEFDAKYSEVSLFYNHLYNTCTNYHPVERLSSKELTLEMFRLRIKKRNQELRDDLMSIAKNKKPKNPFLKEAFESKNEIALKNAKDLVKRAIKNPPTALVINNDLQFSYKGRDYVIPHAKVKSAAIDFEDLENPNLMCSQVISIKKYQKTLKDFSETKDYKDADHKTKWNWIYTTTLKEVALLIEPNPPYEEIDTWVDARIEEIKDIDAKTVLDVGFFLRSTFKGLAVTRLYRSFLKEGKSSEKTEKKSKQSKKQKGKVRKFGNSQDGKE